MRANRLSSILITAVVTFSAVATTMTVSAPASATTALACSSYTVRTGDSLTTIANRFGVTVNQIVSWNPWLRAVNYKVYPGDVLQIC